MTTLVQRVAGILALIGGTAVASEKAGLAGAEFDFGTVPQNATLVHETWLHAGPTDTLRLVDIKSGCGCLTAPWEPTGIAPGDSLRLVFYWQTRGFEGQRDLSAFVYAEPEPYPLELSLGGKVVTENEPQASLEVTPRRIDFGSGRENKTETMVSIRNSSAVDLATTLVAVGPGIKVEVPEKIEAGSSIGVKVTRTGDTGSLLETSFTIEAAGNPEAKQRVSIPVKYGDFSFRPEFTTTRR
jgi:hypothetical protein